MLVDEQTNNTVAAGMIIADLVVDGEAVVHAVLSKFYDVVLLDCQMPKLDGYEATRAIRRLAIQADFGRRAVRLA